MTVFDEVTIYQSLPDLNVLPTFMFVLLVFVDDGFVVSVDGFVVSVDGLVTVSFFVSVDGFVVESLPDDPPYVE